MTDEVTAVALALKEHCTARDDATSWTELALAAIAALDQFRSARIAQLEAELAVERQKREFAEYREHQAELTMTESLIIRADEDERNPALPAFKPCVINLPDADLTQIVLRDVPTVASETVTATVLRDLLTRVIVGVQWDTAAPARPLPQRTDKNENRT